jgi:hypothetical protein
VRTLLDVTLDHLGSRPWSFRVIVSWLTPNNSTKADSRMVAMPPLVLLAS